VDRIAVAGDRAIAAQHQGVVAVLGPLVDAAVEEAVVAGGDVAVEVGGDVAAAGGARIDAGVGGRDVARQRGGRIADQDAAGARAGQSSEDAAMSTPFAPDAATSSDASISWITTGSVGSPITLPTSSGRTASIPSNNWRWARVVP